MALIPSNTVNIGEPIEVVSQPTHTYYLDTINNRIVGHVDGIQAIKQAIYKIINTERYSYLIYSWNYGIELESLIGKDPLFVSAELQRVFKESLTQDDRILSLSGFSINQNEEGEFAVSFIVNTIEGNIFIEGVTVSV